MLIKTQVGYARERLVSLRSTFFDLERPWVRDVCWLRVSERYRRMEVSGAKIRNKINASCVNRNN